MHSDTGYIHSIPLPGIPAARHLDSVIALTPAPIRPLATRTLGWLRTHLYPVEDSSEERPPSTGRRSNSESSDDMPLSNSDMLKQAMSVFEVPFVDGEDEYDDVKPTMPPTRVTDLMDRQRKLSRSPSMSHATTNNQRRRLLERKRDQNRMSHFENYSNNNSASVQQYRLRGRQEAEDEWQPDQRLRSQGVSEVESPRQITNIMTMSRPSDTTVSNTSYPYKRENTVSSNSRMVGPRNNPRDYLTSSMMMERSDIDWNVIDSQYIISPKIRISPDKQQKIERELKEALTLDVFNVWPTYEDDRESRHDLRSRRNVEGRRAKKQVQESRIFEQQQGDKERRRKEELLREWKKKEERGVDGRRRVRGGWESVVENRALTTLDGFVPTIRNMPKRVKTPTDAELEAMENEERA